MIPDSVPRLTKVRKGKERKVSWRDDDERDDESPRPRLNHTSCTLGRRWKRQNRKLAFSNIVHESGCSAMAYLGFSLKTSGGFLQRSFLPQHWIFRLFAHDIDTCIC